MGMGEESSNHEYLTSYKNKLQRDWGAKHLKDTRRKCRPGAVAHGYSTDFKNEKKKKSLRGLNDIKGFGNIKGKKDNLLLQII